MSERFPIPESTLAICTEVVHAWRDTHFPNQNLEEQIRILASRVNSWVSGVSVVAGVRDVMSCIPTGPDHQEKIDDLGTKLGRRLTDEGLLIASPRRSASMG